MTAWCENSRGAIRLLIKAFVVLHVESHATFPALEARLVPDLTDRQTDRHANIPVPVHNQSHTLNTCITTLVVRLSINYHGYDKQTNTADFVGTAFVLSCG